MIVSRLLLLCVFFMGMLCSCGGTDDSSSDACQHTATIEPLDCSKGGCIGESWTSGKNGAYGDPCQSALNCQSQLCAFDSATNIHYCTQTCDLSSQTPCPEGAECFASEDGKQDVCGPPAKYECQN
jgi:hypothetical protein